VIELPHHLMALWDSLPGERPDTAMGSAWSNRRDRIIHLLGEVRFMARWPMRNARAIRAIAEDLTARIGAADSSWFESRKPLTFEDIVNISDHGLIAVVMPKRAVVEREVEHYKKHGFATSLADCRVCQRERLE
jgi:hypothetical protein